MMRRALPWLLGAWLLTGLPLHAQDKQDKACDVTIGSCHRDPLSAEGQGIIDRIIQEAFRRIGRRSCVVALPCERSLMNANSGELDGDILRIPAVIEQRYPHLRPVSEPLYLFPMSAFSLGRDLHVEKFEDLAALRVGYLIGWKVLEDKVRAAGVMRVRGPNELFTLLAEDRADVVIYERLTGLKTAEEMGLKQVQALAPPLMLTPQHLMLHERHAALLDPLASALRAMKSDGSYERVFRQAGVASPASK